MKSSKGTRIVLFLNYECRRTKLDLKQVTIDAAVKIHELALDKSAEKVIALDVEGICSYTDVLIVCHGRSARQAQTIASHIAKSMKQQGDAPVSVEGEAQGHWILIDFFDVIVHVFYEPVREYYGVESIWPDARPITFD